MRDQSVSSDEPAPRPAEREVTEPTPAQDRVEEASRESFPASDPPAWAPLRAGPPGERTKDRGPR